MLRRITNKSNLFRFQHCSCSFSSKPDYDVLIVGGGVVGQSVAAGLISSPNTSSLRIGIIDTQPAISIEDATINASSQPDLRVYALAPASISSQAADKDKAALPEEKRAEAEVKGKGKGKEEAKKKKKKRAKQRRASEERRGPPTELPGEEEDEDEEEEGSVGEGGARGSSTEEAPS